MGRNRLLDMIDKLSQQQVERLTEIAVEYLNLNTELANTAEFDSTIEKICVANGQMVEYGTELFRIKR